MEELKKLNWDALSLEELEQLQAIQDKLDGKRADISSSGFSDDVETDDE